LVKTRSCTRQRLGESFELSGGYIRNAVLPASYRAWANSEAITMDALESVAAAECRASGKLFRPTKQRASVPTDRRER